MMLEKNGGRKKCVWKRMGMGFHDVWKRMGTGYKLRLVRGLRLRRDGDDGIFTGDQIGWSKGGVF